jgi:hypothetical protein
MSAGAVIDDERLNASASIMKGRRAASNNSGSEGGSSGECEGCGSARFDRPFGADVDAFGPRLRGAVDSGESSAFLFPPLAGFFVGSVDGAVSRSSPSASSGVETDNRLRFLGRDPSFARTFVISETGRGGRRGEVGRLIGRSDGEDFELEEDETGSTTVS